MHQSGGMSVHTPLVQSGARTTSRRSKHVILGALALMAVAACVGLVTLGAKKAGPVSLVANIPLPLVNDRVSGFSGATVHEHVLSIVEKPSALHATTSLSLTSAEETELLDQHNALRCMHEEPLMAWDATLASQAQAWADQIKADDASTCFGGHSVRDSSFRNGAGENIAWGSTSDYFTSNNRDFGTVATMWYNEVEFYDFDQPGSSINVDEPIGHFTQVVWKGSTKLGCGMASCGGGQIVICQYDPPGNYIGQYSANVDLPTKTAVECSAGTVKVPCSADSTCADKASSSSSSGDATSGGDEESVPTSCELEASPADSHCKIKGTGCAGEQISFKCKNPKEGGRWGEYAAYSSLGYGFTTSTDAFDNDYTADCEQCLDICEHEGVESCLDNPAPPPPPPPPPAGACQVTQSGAGGCVLDIKDCAANQKIQYKCKCTADYQAGSPGFCASYPGYTLTASFWSSLGTYSRDNSGGCDVCTDAQLKD